MFIVFLFLASVSGKIFIQDGVLNPEDYNNADKLMVEVWGAGGGGCGSVTSPCMNGAGGGAGAYVKALIEPKSNSFLITVGMGSRGEYSTESAKGLNQDHIHTTFQSTDGSISIIAHGGLRPSQPEFIGFGGKPGEIIGAERIFASEAGEDGQVGFRSEKNAPFGGRGGNAFRLGEGGQGFGALRAQPGSFPAGGGGGAWNDCPEYCDFVPGGNGANGLVVVYVPTEEEISCDTFEDYQSDISSNDRTYTYLAIAIITSLFLILILVFVFTAFGKKCFGEARNNYQNLHDGIQYEVNNKQIDYPHQVEFI